MALAKSMSSKIVCGIVLATSMSEGNEKDKVHITLSDIHRTDASGIDLERSSNCNGDRDTDSDSCSRSEFQPCKV